MRQTLIRAKRTSTRPLCLDSSGSLATSLALAEFGNLRHDRLKDEDRPLSRWGNEYKLSVLVVVCLRSVDLIAVQPLPLKVLGIGLLLRDLNDPFAGSFRITAAAGQLIAIRDDLDAGLEEGDPGSGGVPADAGAVPNC